MKPKSNGLVSLHDDRKGKGFECMKLIKFLFGNEQYKSWDKWHEAHRLAKSGKCLFKDKCDIYNKTFKKKSVQLELFE